MTAQPSFELAKHASNQGMGMLTWGAEQGALSTKSADCTVSLCFGRNNRDTGPVRRTVRLHELAAMLRVPEAGRGKPTRQQYLAMEKAEAREAKNGPYFTAAQFDQPGVRQEARVIKMHGFVLDIDTGQLSLADIKVHLEGLVYFLYSSFSHQASFPKWRVFIPYREAILAAKHRSVYRHFQARFEDNLDAKCESMSQPWYLPACPSDAVGEYVFFMNDGEFFDPMSLTDDDPPPSAPASAVATGAAQIAPRLHAVGSSLSPHSTIERVRSALAVVPADDRAIWIKFGLALKKDLGADAGYDLWISWSKTWESFDQRDADQAWYSFHESYEGVPVTLGTIFHEACKYGWSDDRPRMHEKLQALNECHFLATDGGKLWVFEERIDPATGYPMLRRLSPEGFIRLHDNDRLTFPSTSASGKPRLEGKGKAWLVDRGRRTYDGIYFDPSRSASERLYNTYRGLAVTPTPGDWSLLKAHIANVICRGDERAYEYLMNWLAFGVQRPERPAEVAVVLQGQRGTGMGVLAQAYGALFGPHFLQVSTASHLIGNFNGHLRSTIFLFVDEAIWAGDKTAENVLKALITESKLNVELKGQDVVTVPNRLHIIMASNNDWVVPAGPFERRFFVLCVGDQRMQDHGYFAAISDQLHKQGGLAAMAHDLLERDLSAFNIRAFPRTAALDGQVLQSLDPAVRWWIDHMREDFSPVAWRYQVRSQLALNFAGVGGRHADRASETRLGQLLNKVLPSPGLKKVTYKGPGMYVKAGCYEFPALDLCRAHIMTMYRLQHDLWACESYTSDTSPT